MTVVKSIECLCVCVVSRLVNAANETFTFDFFPQKHTHSPSHLIDPGKSIVIVYTNYNCQ